MARESLQSRFHGAYHIVIEQGTHGPFGRRFAWQAMPPQGGVITHEGEWQLFKHAMQVFVRRYWSEGRFAVFFLLLLVAAPIAIGIAVWKAGRSVEYSYMVLCVLPLIALVLCVSVMRSKNAAVDRVVKNEVGSWGVKMGCSVEYICEKTEGLLGAFSTLRVLVIKRSGEAASGKPHVTSQAGFFNGYHWMSQNGEGGGGGQA